MIKSNFLNKLSYSQFLGQLTVLNQATNATILPETRLFGVGGIRGRTGANELLNPALAVKVGFWAGQILQTLSNYSAPVIIGQDSRNSSNILSMALAEGLVAAGVEVWNLGLCPTTAIAYLANATKAMGGIMISTSHNPPENNGIEFFGSNGTKLSALVQSQIEAGVRGQLENHHIKLLVARDWGKQYYKPELLDLYLESLQKPFAGDRPIAGMKVVLDLACGAAVKSAGMVFAAMGAEIITLNDRAKGSSTHLESLQKAVLEHRADMGFAFNGDAKRVMAVDNLGRVVDGERILYLWGKALRQNNQLPASTIVSTVMANLGFENAWKSLGGRLVRTPVGEHHVCAKMAEIGAKLGGEQSGYILCPLYGVSSDGILTALHLAVLVKQSGKSLNDLLAHSFPSYPRLWQNVRVEDSKLLNDWQQCQPLQQAIAEAETAMSSQGRVLVRPCDTEPLICLMVEAINIDLASHWTEKLVACIQEHLTSNIKY